ncbi:N-myc downstream regulated, partial [Fasciolopsis buskii]
ENTIQTKSCGPIRVYIQGSKTSNIVFLTVHDLGCNHEEMMSFVENENMEQMAERCSWIHVEVPGQGGGDTDLPSDYEFPTMQQLAKAMGEICDNLKLKHVVVFGEGAGANILARFAMLREELVLGAVLIHCNPTSAGAVENIRDRVIGRKLNNIGMNPAAESYLIFHRFGTVNDKQEDLRMKPTLNTFRKSLQNEINPRNLNKFIMSYMARTKIINDVDQLRCPVLLLTGALSTHSQAVHRFFKALRKSAENEPDRLKCIELIQFDDVANVLRGRPERVSDSLQYFIQGLGLGGGIVNRRMSNTIPPQGRARSYSMEEYDQPKGVALCVFDKNRKYSTAFDEGDDETSEV